MIRALYLIPLCVVAAAGCKQPVDLGGEFRTVLHVEPEPITAVDILFVVDDSGSMGDEQRDLVDAAGDYLFATLEAELGELPDMHVAVISTNVGAGPYNISGCSPGGADDGTFRSEPRIAGCSPPLGTFIEDAPDPAGGRIRNFEGTLSDTFACIARLGIDGCGFEQPLESARRALDGRHPENDGFLRDDALLLLVVLTDEDDCSAFDTVMFDTSQDATEALGQLSSYRCFEFGVECDEDPRSIGEKTNCRPREDSEFITSIGEFADFFRGIKTNPSQVAVSVISGGNGSISTYDAHPDRYNEYPELNAMCERTGPPECEDIVWPIDAGNPDAGPPAPPGDPIDAGTGLTPQDCKGGGETYPSVRLAAFLDEFPGRAHFTPLCDFTMATHLESTARLAADVMGRSPCLRGALVDADRAESGVQAKCRGYDVDMAAGTVQGRVAVPSCEDSGGAMPCFRVSESAECDHLESQLAAQIERAESTARPTHFVVECLTPLGR